jgi:hypothetical protein
MSERGSNRKPMPDSSLFGTQEGSRLRNQPTLILCDEMSLDGMLGYDMMARK